MLVHGHVAHHLLPPLSDHDRVRMHHLTVRSVSAKGDTLEAVDEVGRAWRLRWERDARYASSSPRLVFERESEGPRSLPPTMERQSWYPRIYPGQLPTGSIPEMEAYLAHLLRQDSRPALIWVGPEGPHGRTARMLDTDDRRRPFGIGDVHGPLEAPVHPSSVVGTMLLADEAVELPECGWSEGDLVVGSGVDCDVVDGRVVTTIRDPVVVGRFPSEEALGAFLPRYGENRRWWVGLTGFAEHVRDVELAWASTEPDEALVLFHEDLGADNGSVVPTVLGHTGRTFALCDNVGDEMHGSAQPAGLWVYGNAKWWSSTSHEGEHDAGIEGDWRPATPDDVKRFGIDAGVVGDALERDVTGGEFAGLLATLCADAAQGAEAEAEALAARHANP